MNHPIIEFRPYYSDDIPEILRIQKANLVSNLSESDRVNGFSLLVFEVPAHPET